MMETRLITDPGLWGGHIEEERYGDKERERALV